MAELRKTFDSLPWIATLLLVIFVDAIYGGLYRLSRGDTAGIVIGILWFVTGSFFGIGFFIGSDHGDPEQAHHVPCVNESSKKPALPVFFVRFG